MYRLRCCLLSVELDTKFDTKFVFVVASVDGGWSEWSHLDACSAKPCSQEIGFRIRFRSCTSPSPMFGGLPCQGRSWKRETCYNNDFCTKPGISVGIFMPPPVRLGGGIIFGSTALGMKR